MFFSLIINIYRYIAIIQNIKSTFIHEKGYILHIFLFFLVFVYVIIYYYE